MTRNKIKPLPRNSPGHSSFSTWVRADFRYLKAHRPRLQASAIMKCVTNVSNYSAKLFYFYSLPPPPFPYSFFISFCPTWPYYPSPSSYQPAGQNLRPKNLRRWTVSYFTLLRVHFDPQPGQQLLQALREIIFIRSHPHSSHGTQFFYSFTE